MKLKPALLSATKNSHSDVNQTMDSYYAEVVINESPYSCGGTFCSERESGKDGEAVRRDPGSPASHTGGHATVLPAIP